MAIYQAVRRSWPYVGPILGTLFWGVALGYTPSDVLLAIKAGVERFSNTQIGLLLVGALAFFFAYVEWRHRGIPITAISTEVDLILEDSLGKTATLVRRQKLRAHQNDVVGYHRCIAAEGSIKTAEMMFTVSHCSQSEQSIHLDERAGKLDIVHRFKPIVVNPWMLGLNTIRREESVQICNGFCSEDEHYELEINERYRHKKIRLTVYFPPGTDQVVVSSCKALRISDNGLTEVGTFAVPQQPGRGPGVRVDIKNPRAGDRFRISWHNSRISTGQS